MRPTHVEQMFRHVVVGNLDRSDARDATGLPLAAAAYRTYFPTLELIAPVS